MSIPLKKIILPIYIYPFRTLLNCYTPPPEQLLSVLTLRMINVLTLPLVLLRLPPLPNVIIVH